MPYQKLTHEKCQEKICAVCFQKSKRKVSKATIELIKEHTINKAYDISDSRLPTGIVLGTTILATCLEVFWWLCGNFVTKSISTRNCDS